MLQYFCRLNVLCYVCGFRWLTNKTRSYFETRSVSQYSISFGQIFLVQLKKIFPICCQYRDWYIYIYIYIYIHTHIPIIYIHIYTDTTQLTVAVFMQLFQTPVNTSCAADRIQEYRKFTLQVPDLNSHTCDESLAHPHG